MIKKIYSLSDCQCRRRAALSIIEIKSKDYTIEIKKHICAITSAMRSSFITIIIYKSGAGIFIPQIIIFLRKNMYLPSG